MHTVTSVSNIAELAYVSFEVMLTTWRSTWVWQQLMERINRNAPGAQCVEKASVVFAFLLLIF